jgi:hypothetical protein
MRSLKFFFTLVLLACSVVWAADTSDDELMEKRGSCGVNTFISNEDLLAMHNVYRAAAGLPLLQWDDSLAQFAQCWSARCRFEHSHRQGFGENIACGNGNLISPAIGVKNWWDEYKLWQYGEGYAEATGHFTQMAWADTRRVGCGISDCPAGNLGLSGGSRSSTFVVCSYWPPGNVIGKFNGEVKKPSYEPDVTEFIIKTGQGDSSPLPSPTFNNDYDATSSSPNSGAQQTKPKGQSSKKNKTSSNYDFGDWKKGTGHAHNPDGTSWYTPTMTQNTHKSSRPTFVKPNQQSSNDDGVGLLGSLRRRRHHEIAQQITKRDDDDGDDCDED